MTTSKRAKDYVMFWPLNIVFIISLSATAQEADSEANAEERAPKAAAEIVAETPASPVATAVESETPASPSATLYRLLTEEIEEAEAKKEEAKPKKKFTGLYGVVEDSKTGEPLIEATVRVVKGGKQHTLTDIDGNYELKLPPGKYELRVFYELYKGRKISEVVVEKGKATLLNVALDPDIEAEEVVVVEAKADTRKAAAVLQERKRAVTVSDSISAQEISRTPDSNASDAVKRVVSTTIVGGKYVLVRGLGGRYGSTLLNRVNLPSPEPDEQAVPLDLFPAALLSNLTVAKTYNPDLPGNFGGGALMIETNSYPTFFEAKFKLGTSMDTVSTFRQRLNHEGGKGDYFGFDGGARKLPEAVPQDRPALAGEDISAEDIEKIGESFKNIWTSELTRAYPNWSVGGMVGDTLRPGNTKLGYLLSLNFSHKETIQKADVAKVKIEKDKEGNDSVVYREQMESESGIESASLGGLANIGFKPHPYHDLNLFTLYTHTGEKKTNFVNGYNETDNKFIEATRLLFVERSLVFTQLTGDHKFPEAYNFNVDWQANYSYTMRREPDTRDIIYQVLDDGKRRFKSETGSGERYFSELDDNSAGGGLNFTQPIPLAGSLKLGGSVQHSAREFNARRFRFTFIGRNPEPVYLPPDEIFNPDNIGPFFRIGERTLPSDAYDASLLVGTGYLMFDITAADPVRIVPGLRFEYADQSLAPGSDFAITDLEVESVDRQDKSWLPSLNVVWAITPEMNLRAAYSYTLARPQFRELAPFLYFDFTRRRSVSGNPALEQTRIHNADLRYEWFLGDAEVVAASLFYKRFINPIETVVVDASFGSLSYANADGADTFGGELESRISLRHFTEHLRELHLGMNLTLIKSKIRIGEDYARHQTNPERPLQGQSPYVFNLVFSWISERYGTELSLLYNVFGKRITEVGVDTLPDTYEQPFHRLDFTASQDLGKGFQMKLGLSNLAYQKVVYRQGGLDVFSYQPGLTGALSLEWSY